jgi:hypothetical protein
MRRKLVIAAVVTVVALLGGLAAVSWLLDSERLGRAMLARAGEAAGIELRARSTGLSLFRGLELDGVEAAGRYIRGRYEISVRRLSFEWRLLPLLFGDIVVDRVRLEQPAVRVLVTGEEAPPEAFTGAQNPHPPAGEGNGRRLEVVEVVLTEGAVQVVDARDGQEVQTFTMEGLALVLRDIVFDPAETTPLRRLTGNGELTAERAQTGGLPMRDLEGRFTLEKGVLEARHLAMVTDYGPVTAQVTADFNQVPMTYRISVEAQPLDTNRLAGIPEGGSLGPARLEFQAVGQGTDPRDLTGSGTLQLEPGRIPDHEVLRRAERLLGLTGLAGGEYRATAASFEVAARRVTLAGFSLESARAGLALEGWVDLQGPLDLRLTLNVERRGVALERVPPQVLDLLADERGRLAVPLRVSGTREEPDVAVDVQALLSRAGEGIGRRLGGRPSDLLDRLLRP